MNIVSLSSTPFDVGFCSRQGLSLALSRHCGLHYFWSEPRPAWNTWQDLMAWPRPMRASRDLVLYTPPKFLPRIHWRPRVEAVLRAGRVIGFRNALMNGWTGPRILYVWDPHFVDYIGSFNEDLICYHIYDNHRAWFSNEADLAAMIEKENRLLQAADLIVTAHRLLADFHGVGDRAVYCPAAVSSVFIDRVSKVGSRTPPDMPTGGPVIGYVGAINTKVDLDVLEELASRDPSWKIVLIGWLIMSGQLLEQFNRFVARKNVFYLGAKPWDQLPGYMAHFDVGLLCYKPTEWSSFCVLTLKMFEYLAAGKPVVGGGLPHLSSMGGLIKISRDPQEFADNVEKSLAEDSPEKRQRRIAVARENTWDVRAVGVMAAIRQAIEGRRTSQKH